MIKRVKGVRGSELQSVKGSFLPFYSLCPFTPLPFHPPFYHLFYPFAPLHLKRRRDETAGSMTQEGKQQYHTVPKEDGTAAPTKAAPRRKIAALPLSSIDLKCSVFFRISGFSKNVENTATKTRARSSLVGQIQEANLVF